MRHVFAASTALTLLLGACTNAASNPSSSPAPSSRPTVVALLADNQLVTLSADAAKIVQALRLGPAPGFAQTQGRFMALTQASSSRAVVLVPGVGPGGDHLVFIDLTTLRIAAQRNAPDDNVSYRSLAVGAKTGRIYLFGNRAVGPDAGPAHGSPSDAIVTVLDPIGESTISSWTVRPSAGFNWYIFRGAVSADERQLFISYHGPDTTGMDIVSITAQGFHRCQPLQSPDSACVPIHGDFEVFGDGFLAATGSAEVVQLHSSGQVTRRFDTKLENNHLMEFAVDEATHLLYAPGSCLYEAGLSSVNLTSGEARFIDRLGGPVCAERIVIAGQTLILLQARPTGVLFVDRQSGTVRRQVATPAEPIDALVISG